MSLCPRRVCKGGKDQNKETLEYPIWETSITNSEIGFTTFVSTRGNACLHPEIWAPYMPSSLNKLIEWMNVERQLQSSEPQTPWLFACLLHLTKGTKIVMVIWNDPQYHDLRGPFRAWSFLPPFLPFLTFSHISLSPIILYACTVHIFHLYLYIIINYKHNYI